jgi:hypothetical protein
MKLPKRLHLTSYEFVLDGGTIYLMGTDEKGRQRTIMLAQSLFPDPALAVGVPGRLYIDDELVPVRSPMEADLLALLKSAAVAHQPHQRSRPPAPPPFHPTR